VPAVTIHDVRDAVHAALEEVFPNIPVTDEISQNLSPPCLYVQLLQPTQTQELGRRFMRNHPFDVQYFASEPGSDDLYAMAEQLIAALQQVEAAGRPVRGTGIRFQITDGVLHFFVEYHFHVWAPQPEDPAMAGLDVTEGIKR
jgi:hypothetical protein